jgi:hypothetical protein
MSDASYAANTAIMLEAKLEEAASQRAALLRKIKAAIIDARKFSDEMEAGFIGQRIVDIIERAVISEKA